MDKALEVGDNHEGLQKGSNEINSDTVFTPQVQDEYIPRVGQEFESLNEVLDFYNNYAKQTGFSVRIHSSLKNKKTNEIIRKEYVCYKEGMPPKEAGNESKRRRGKVREGCKAKIAVLKSKRSTKYVISQFVEAHNHALATPQKVLLLRSHRNVSEVKKSAEQQKDLNGCERDLRNEMKGHDAEMLSEHFLGEKAKNEAFFFKMEADHDDRLRHCFWADATSRRAYKFYGDVVVFNTTYNANRYGMIFASLMGINNHGQTIIFACAFLSNEATDSFVWLFEQFKKAMPVGPPKMIITDQDAAISKAIAQAFPTSFHRYCVWHILNKFSERLNAIIYRDYYREFEKCICDSDTKEEFDSKWVDVVEKSGLKDNVWLMSIYELRPRWVPSYVKHVFSAGLSSSQQAESSHEFFKQYVSRKNSLMDFVIRLDMALVDQRHAELSADHVDVNEQPVLKLPLLMEKQMADIYTRKIFHMFQEELWESLACVLELTRLDDNHCVYKVIEKKKDGSSKVREIVYEKATDYASCSCKKYEFHGIPCRHLLAYLKREQVEILPNQYILKRWTRLAKSDIVVDIDGEEIKDCGDNSLLMRQTRLSKLASELIDCALVSEEASKFLLENFEIMLGKIKSLVDS